MPGEEKNGETAQPDDLVPERKRPDRYVEDPYNFDDTNYDYSSHPEPFEDWRKDYDAWVKPEVPAGEAVAEPAATAVVPVPPPAPPPVPPATRAPAPEPEPEPDDDDEGMLRMSFLEHLEELRSRIIKALMGLGVAFALAVAFSNELWKIVSEPATAALTSLKLQPNLIITSPMDGFMTIWVKLPMLAAIFLASPWVLWQVWSFVAPGLYKKERRWAAPFVISTAGLFILGGLFAYFVAFRFGLTFLLGIGLSSNVVPYITINEYFDLFINVMLGVGLVFELPVLIFFLVLIRVVTPGFLLRNSRYAILLIVIVAAVLTPTPDVVNLTLFAVPMVLLYFVGVFAGYLLNVQRDQQRFPWMAVLLVTATVILMSAGVIGVLVAKYGFKLIPVWPFLVR